MFVVNLKTGSIDKIDSRYISAYYSKNDIKTDILDYLGNLAGVVRIEEMDDTVFRKLKDEENGIILSGGMEYDNWALDECYNKDTLLCLFCDGFVEECDEISMIMMDCFGNITGHDIPDCMKSEFENRTDVLWLSDCFVLLPNSKQKSESKMVILPRKFKALDRVPEISNITCFYPSTSSDLMLKKEYGVKNTDNMTTLIVGFDIRPDRF